jgi:hypothetical protein
MKKLLTSTFLLLYAAFTVALTTEATLSLSHRVHSAGKANVIEMRPYSPHCSQRRFVEQPFQIVPAFVAAPLTRIESHIELPAATKLADNINPQAPSRAPPAFI